MRQNKRSYTREFKIEAAKLTHSSDKNVEEIANNLGISKSTRHRWRSEFRNNLDQAFPGKGHLKEQDAEIAQLKKVKKALRQAQMETECIQGIVYPTRAVARAELFDYQTNAQFGQSVLVP